MSPNSFNNLEICPFLVKKMEQNIFIFPAGNLCFETIFNLARQKKHPGMIAKIWGKIRAFPDDSESDPFVEISRYAKSI